MKMLPLALVLITTPALAQVSTPVLRKGAERPRATWTPSATPAPSPAKASDETAARPKRPVFKPKPTPQKAEAQAATAEASEPKKRGGFFGFFGKLFGGGKKKTVTPGATAGTAAPTAPPGNTRQSAAAAKPGAVADSGSSIRPNLRGTSRGTTSSIVPPLTSEREKNADRSAIIPPTVQGAKPDAANAELIRPSLNRPASGSTGASSIKPTLKPASSGSEPSSIKPSLKPVPSGSEPSSIIPPVSPKNTSTSLVPGAMPETTTEFDKARYGKVKREAATDPAIVQLAQKLNATAPGAAYKKAARSYANALFAKMREIDPSQQQWIDRMENATIRRIEAGKAFVAE